MTQETKSGKYLRPKNKSYMAGTLVYSILLGLGLLSFFSARWYLRIYGDTGFDSIIYTLTAGLDGVQSGLILSFCLQALVPVLGCAAFGCVLLVAMRQETVSRRITRAVALVLSLLLTGQAAFSTGLPSYIYFQLNPSTMFEDHYVDPNSVEITFPEEKRNLIYLYLESMEISYLSEELGGAMEANLIPELYTLAQENLNFSHNGGVGGFLPVSGGTWTIAAMVAHTAGVPLKLPNDVAENDYGQDDNGFLPGITSITDILHDAGYYQTLMVGSVSSFGGRKQYYSQHGADHIYDLSTARRDGIIPGDYFVWWGMEDKYLFEYARQELTEISQKDQPFAFSLLTVDTHHIGGYVCEYCENQHQEQYSNVMSCSSRQVLEFVKWIQAQPFYGNTTIIITGDHPSMDNGYFDRNVEESYTRRMYNCFLNVPISAQNSKNREFSALDMFPTTLAALGCQIEGDRLGLGVNLFSRKPTLIETMGYDRFDAQISMNSDYYAEKFRLEEPES